MVSCDSLFHASCTHCNKRVIDGLTEWVRWCLIYVQWKGQVWALCQSWTLSNILQIMLNSADILLSCLSVAGMTTAWYCSTFFLQAPKASENWCQWLKSAILSNSWKWPSSLSKTNIPIPLKRSMRISLWHDTCLQWTISKLLNLHHSLLMSISNRWCTCQNHTSQNGQRLWKISQNIFYPLAFIYCLQVKISIIFQGVAILFSLVLWTLIS